MRTPGQLVKPWDEGMSDVKFWKKKYLDEKEKERFSGTEGKGRKQPVGQEKSGTKDKEKGDKGKDKVNRVLPSYPFLLFCFEADQL